MATSQKTKQQTDDAAEQAKQKTGEAADQAKQKAGELTDQAKQQATQQLASQKERASTSLSSISKALHDASGTLRNEDQGAVAGYVDDAARQMEQFADVLQNRSVGELLDEAKRYARREPAIFLGGAMVLGLFGARFLKSSSPDASRYRQRGSRYDSNRRSAYQGSSYRSSQGERRSGIYTPDETREISGTQGRAATTSGAALVTPTGTSATAAERNKEEGAQNG